ncbi:hypothetical protein BXZ70DRAFT_973011 [Cristinia sonorae]|uniref:Uncharacterized protein n=1 Tax=Cristinia sonorae TaxID=1940300 RepID=A0A8K0UNW5_9AGAR|nr:hypothetical protein BXZ70DRAFT_973011 [Cristinia sonorae]
MNEAGTPDVPSFSALRAKQKELTKTVGIQTTCHTSPFGNIFYANTPAELYKLDFANPLVRPHMHLYPEVTTSVSEFWQAQRLFNESDLDLLQLMWLDFDNPSRFHCHFYIKELARLCDGRYVVPMMWYTQANVYYADAYIVDYNASTGLFALKDDDLVSIKACDLEYNYLDLKASGSQFTFTPNCIAAHPWLQQMPHPERDDENSPAFSVFSMWWSDDVSGNKTKQYNPHTNVYIANLSLPHRKLQQEYFIRFSSTSTNASSSEQLEAAAKDVGKSKWHKTYDCTLNTVVRFRILPRIEPADNPQQSETCSHIGLKGNFFCRRCMVGGTNEQKESDEGYHALFVPGTPRDPIETRAVVERQLHLAALGVDEDVVKVQRETGVKDKIAQYWIDRIIPMARQKQQDRTSPQSPTCDSRLRDRNLKGDARKQMKETIKHEIQREMLSWLIQQPPDRYAALPDDSPARYSLRPGDHYNIMLSLPGVDIHRDTPVEPLHTWTIGLKKYTWHAVNSQWDSKKDEIYAIRLRSSSVDGLSIPPVRGEYLVQYKNSLVGKHFKALQQIGVFHLYGDVCSPLLLELWKAGGELGAMLWYHTIHDMDQYLADLEVLIANVLDIWACIDPERILNKPKIHIFPHILQDIRNFGPSIIFSTEIFECWNAIFRFCSILSNHHAPSLDIATTLADVERFKHQVSGGWWKAEDGIYVQAGHRVRSFMQENPKLQQRLGWVPTASHPAASIALSPQAKRMPKDWNDLISHLKLSEYGLVEPRRIHGAAEERCLWLQCKHVVAQSGDICKSGSWIFFSRTRLEVPESEDCEGVTPGRILDIRAPSGIHSGGSSEGAVVFVEVFQIASELHDRLRMPVMTPLPGSQGTVIISPKAVQFVFNAQHDCYTHACAATRGEFVRQERQVTTRVQKLIEHSPVQQFVLNMHALHNAELIRQTLPREMWAPKPYLPDRLAKHRDIAAGLRVTRPIKRLESQAKSANTRAKNRAAQEETNRRGQSQLPAKNSSRNLRQPEMDEGVSDDGQGDNMVLD